MSASPQHRWLVGLLLAVLLVTSPGWPIPRPALAAEPPGLDQVVAVAAGGSHTLALRADGTVWGWGSNSDWELGVTTEAGMYGSDTPVQATGLEQVRALATGDDHGLALTADGRVWGWGKNDHGQVGVAQGENCPYHPRPCAQTPVPVPGLSDIKAVAATRDSSFAVGADGTVWAWGDNGYGELGTGSGADGLAPARVEGLSAIVSLSAMSPRVVAVQAGGAVWGWGGNDAPRTPIQISGLDDMAAVAAGAIRNLALKADGTVWTWGERDHPAPALVEGLGPMVAIDGGGLLSGTVAADGTVWTWGISPLSANPEPPTQTDGLSDVTAIILGLEDNVALKADGTVWTWSEYDRPRPVPAPTAATPTP